MSYALGQFDVDYEARVDYAELRRKRVEKTRTQMAAHRLDGLLVWKDENVRYLTGLRAQLIAGKSSSLNGVLFPRDAEPILLCSGGERDRALAKMPWLAEVHAIPVMEERGLVEGFVRSVLKPALARHKLLAGRLGVDQPTMILVEAIRTLLPDIELVDGDSAMQQARLVKLPEEIAVIEEACAIGEAVTRRALDAVREGRRECEVAGDAMQTLYYLGGEMAHVITPFVASGEHMSPPHRICSDKLIRNHDVCFIDIGAMWNGYFADIGRMTIVGKPSRRQKEVYTAVFQGLQAGIATMRPGKTNLDVSRAIVDKIAEFGLAEHLFSLFIGHGIGMGANEPPYIGETMEGATVYPLQPGMVFAVEPLVWVPDVEGGAGVRIEDMVLVTEGAPRILSRIDYEDRLLL
ncbi:MAG TPA: Xaa-Pro peptidase family protein [Methylomirabilota bacterium]|jgi:Xaa-Pro dipeptidase|nr:Xaa-Pro peptidase family protein [Methylomirabilota bacterium]